VLGIEKVEGGSLVSCVAGATSTSMIATTSTSEDDVW
jgi:hypothetical protein